MSTLLEKHLHAACEAHESLKRLRNQWAYDRELIPKALQSIGSTFPHYSRHDQSHSDQILINIERILGPERISQLSATDTWLLLEAAYWHDIGMVVTHDALSQALQDPAFIKYIEETAQNKNHELQKFAQHFNPHHAATAFSGANTPLDALDKFRSLMAEWFRRKHAKAAESIILDPWKAAGISSPRTELIPQRLFLLLGQICSMHGEDFNAVIQTMKYRETGQANDHCHPRFIACMLRLGDLLDIEDNRFCPVMQKISGEQRPALSKAHEDKHKSLRHFRLDEKRIEIEAVCAQIDGYVEQWNWLDSLEKELKQQMSRWSDIAPSKAFGLLPTLGEIKLSLNGNELIHKGQRPQFRLDQDKVMALLKGDNLYKRHDMIRELIQNAIDATLIRAWLEAQRNGDAIEDTPEGKKAKEYLGKYPVCIAFKRITPQNEGSNQTEWELSIHDAGVGMDLEDLTYISSVGGSSKNIRKQDIIKQMPEWMRPSGVFGLGLQSVFMWTEQLNISTCSYFVDAGLDIVFHNPNAVKKGLIEIKKQSNNQTIGSTLSIRFFVGEASGLLRENSLTTRAWSSYDPLLDNGFDGKIWQLVDETHLKTVKSPVPVQISVNGAVLPSQIQEPKGSDQLRTVFVKDANAYFGVQLFARSDGIPKSNVISYRGQPVEKLETKDGERGSFDHYFLKYHLDVLSGKADQWLTFDRSRLTELGLKKMEETIEVCLKQWVTDNLSAIGENTEHLAVLSTLAKWRELKLDDEDGFWASISQKYPTEWLGLNCFSSQGESITLQGIVDATEGVCIFTGHKSEILDLLEDPILQGKTIVQLPDFEAWLLSKYWLELNEKNGFRILHARPPKNTVGLRFMFELIKINNSQKKINIHKESLTKWMAYKAFSGVWGSSNRLFFPCFLLPEEIDSSRLLLGKGVKLKGVRYLFDLCLNDIPHCVLPFELPKAHLLLRSNRISLDRLSEFIDWVMDNVEDKTVTRREVEEEYQKIINYFDNDLMESNQQWQSAIGQANATEQIQGDENE
jgi:hypothetical protein